ncbi:hypothetical protein RclHR1_04370008 [Rhizophagus clarus]|uniref:Reverse transcriptase domain-containing protein n=1 Tax=Rhizophagus clarus TaxID=94130 RepID=A0A2Z6SAU2_9GLOM|nr:hypothetical protein RclHR1_04370008 [Rhizophagus clarus]
MAQNSCHVFRQSDDKFIIEFSTECDLFNACAMTMHFNNYRITGSSRDYNINWSTRNKKLAKIPTIRPPPPVKLVSITYQEDSHHIKIKQEEHHKFSHNPHKHNLKNKQCLSSKPTNPKLLNKRTPHFTGANTVALGKRINSALVTNLPTMDISDISDTSSSSNSLTNHKDGIVEGLAISQPSKLADLLEWCHTNSFDFMGLAKTNSNCINLQHFIKDTYDDCSFLNPEAKEFFWHQRSQDDALRIDTRIDHIWIQHHITPSLRFAHHYDGHTLTESDHDIVAIKLYLPDIFPIAYKHTQPITPHDPNFRELSIKTENITSEHWTLFEAHILDSAHRFAQLINALHNISNTSDPTDHLQRDMDIINHCWADIKDILMSAAAYTLPLRKRNTTHPRLKLKDKPADINKLDRHTAKLSVFIYETHQYQVTTPHDLAAFSRLKDRWESQISLFNKDYADDQNLQFDISFLPDSPGWLDQLKQVVSKRKKAEQKAFNSYQFNKITAAVKARFAIIQSDQTRWISSSLDRHKPNVSIDRLMFRKQNSQIDSLDAHPIWKNAYEPLLKADEPIYESIENNFTLPFWNTILQDINKNSAPGTSGITYQLMCHLPPTFVEVILALYRTIFLTGLVPADWKFSTIFPIPKPEKFEYNMANVRPIALLEVVRKIFTKFISTQLSDILQDHNVLYNANYCGLKGESTASPIRLINNLIEDAKENSKELWIVLQDISKAFDSISLDFLDLALKRISLPSHMVNCIVNLFKGRTVQVATAFGPSPSFQAEDGIDQGDSLSPLLWRIYYDPLLATITALPKKGYNMECVWPHNLWDPDT